MKCSITFLSILICVGGNQEILRAQAGQKIVLSGSINSDSKKPVAAFITIKEAQVSIKSDKDGRYQVTIPWPGNYTIRVASPGFRPVTMNLDIIASIRQDFHLTPAGKDEQGIVIRGERPVQKLSRRSMDAEDFKQIPGSYDDPLNAMVIFPGVQRTNGLKGEMVIRGVKPAFNRYYIDGMPLNYPLHFGSENSTIAPDFMKGIDLYSSCFPAKYGNSLGSVININTADSVDRFGGVFDLNMLTTSLLLKVPFPRNTSDGDANSHETSDYVPGYAPGYAIFGGRYSGLKNLLEYTIAEIKAGSESQRRGGGPGSSGNNAQSKPEYYDYQFKLRYNFNSHHSITVLGVGAGDKQINSYPNDRDEKIDDMFHNQGLYYTYSITGFTNRLLAYSSWSEHNYHQTNTSFLAQYIRANFLSGLPNYGTSKSYPYQCGVKDSFQINWIKNHASLQGELEYAYYLYNYHGSGDLGYNYLRFGSPLTGDFFVTTYPVKASFQNHALGGYLENRFTYKGLTITPGVRTDYLKRSNTATLDPHGTVSYEFESGTTLSAGGGMYSSFVQINPSSIISNNPMYAKAHHAKPERATHFAASIEQAYDLYSFSLEGFYNYFYDLFETYPHIGSDGTYRIGMNTGRMRSYGAEVMIRKKPSINTNTWFGWMSYAYTQSKERSGLFLPTTGLEFQTLNQSQETMYWRRLSNPSVYDTSGNRWINAQYERVHSYKVILGYIFGKHTISGQWQIWTSFPYTNIKTSSTVTGFGSGPLSGSFYIPVYNPTRNTAHYPVNHRLDVRYAYKEPFSWGYVSFYIGVIDCYAPFFKPTTNYETPYPFLPYVPGINPKGYSSRESEGGYRVLGGIAPVIGVEVKF